MPCRHIFGDLDLEPIGTPSAVPVLTHPKAERLFGQKRIMVAELTPVNVEAEERLFLADQ